MCLIFNENAKESGTFLLIIKAEPTNPLFLFKRGIAYVNICMEEGSSIDNAVTDFNMVLKLTPNDPNAIYNRGYAFYIGKDYPLARNDFLELIKCDPDNISNGPTYYNMSLMAYFEKKYDEAIHYLHECDRLGYDVHPQ